MPQEIVSPPRYAVTVTDEAVAAAKRLLTKAGQTTAELGLRIKVGAGGCAGLRYQLYFDDLPVDARPAGVPSPGPEVEDEGYFSADDEDDEDTGKSRAAAGQQAVSTTQPADRDSVVWNGELAVLIDAKSGPYLAGSVIDFAETLDKYGFTIENPNAEGGCACGDSFH